MTMHGDIREELRDEVEDSLPNPLQVLTADAKTESATRKTVDRFRSGGVIRSLAEFYELFELVLTEAESDEGRQYHINFVEDFIPDFATLPCFTAELIAKSPWRDKSGREEFVPRFRESVEDPNNPGNLIQVFQHQAQNEVEITVWAKTNKVANELADWIEEKFFQYMWIFQKSGIGQPVRFLGRNKDFRGEVNGQLIHGRPLRFLVITARITERNETAMRTLALKLGLQYAGSDSF